MLNKRSFFYQIVLKSINFLIIIKSALKGTSALLSAGPFFMKNVQKEKINYEVY